MLPALDQRLFFRTRYPALAIRGLEAAACPTVVEVKTQLATQLSSVPSLPQFLVRSLEPQK